MLTFHSYSYSSASSQDQAAIAAADIGISGASYTQSTDGHPGVETADEYPRVLGVSIGGEVVIAGEDAGVQVGDKVVSYDISSNITRAYQEYAIRDKHKIGKVSVIWIFDRYEPTRT